LKRIDAHGNVSDILAAGGLLLFYHFGESEKKNGF